MLAQTFAPPKRAEITPDDLLTTEAVCFALGGISDVTLWRWTKDVGFPTPDLVIQRRRFWKRATVQSWVETRAATQTAKAA